MRQIPMKDLLQDPSIDAVVRDAAGGKLELEAMGWYKQFRPEGIWSDLDNFGKFTWLAHAQKVRNENSRDA